MQVNLPCQSRLSQWLREEEEAAAVGIETEVIPENGNAGDSVENLGNGNVKSEASNFSAAD